MPRTKRHYPETTQPDMKAAAVDSQNLKPLSGMALPDGSADLTHLTATEQYHGEYDEYN